MKNKMIVLVQIAVVLCSLFLVALPAIAAEQNQAMQKVSTSAITTSSEDDYVLGIYGNANEDDTIDMGDVVYTKLAIFGKKPKTELCDAKYDGRINVLDVIQTKLIILGKEKELTVVDSMKRVVTVSKPIKSIVVLKPAVIEMVRSVGAKDKLIAIGYKEKEYPRFFGDLYHLPSVGYAGATIDCEAILNLNPDIVLLDPWTGHDLCTQALKSANIPVYRVSGHSKYPPGTTLYDYGQEIKKLGYIFDKREEAEEFCDWFYGLMDKINDRVSRLSDDEKPRVYFEYHRDYATSATSSYMDCVVFAGANNIFSDLPPSSGRGPNVDPEAVIVRDPEIIATCRGKVCNYETDDPSEAKAQREAIMNRPGFDHVTAVKDDKVYILPASFMPIYGGAPCHCFIGIAYMAKLFHPELFEDLDPEAIHQEYLTRFQRIDYNVYEQGVFVYPPFED